MIYDLGNPQPRISIYTHICMLIWAMWLDVSIKSIEPPGGQYFAELVRWTDRRSIRAVLVGHDRLFNSVSSSVARETIREATKVMLDQQLRPFIDPLLIVSGQLLVSAHRTIDRGTRERPRRRNSKRPVIFHNQTNVISNTILSEKFKNKIIFFLYINFYLLVK